jgi:hypothetical protein
MLSQQISNLQIIRAVKQCLISGISKQKTGQVRPASQLPRPLNSNQFQEHALLNRVACHGSLSGIRGLWNGSGPSSVQSSAAQDQAQS